MVLIGLTGGIGSGKSTVASGLARRGAVVVDADRIARQVAEPGGGAYDGIVARFGAGVLCADGTLDRAALAAVAFSDPAALADLNRLTHPAIAQAIAARLAEHAGGDAVVILEVPLLDAATKDRYPFAGVIVVDAPVDVAVQRLATQRGMDPADARARVAAQIGREDRRALGDFVIDNSADRTALEPQLERAWEWIVAHRASRG